MALAAADEIPHKARVALNVAPFRLVAPEPFEIDIHEAWASALDKLLLPPAVWACYPGWCAGAAAGSDC